MTSLQATTTRHDRDTARVLRQSVDRSAKRGVLLAMLGGLLLTVAGFVFLLFVLVAVDAFSPLSAGIRWAGLITLCVVTFIAGCVSLIKPWLIRQRALSAAEQIELVVNAHDQPVVRGLTLRRDGDDALTDALRERAERRAGEMAQEVKPARAYPTRALCRQGRWLYLASVGWLVLAIVFPNQLLGVLVRALSPWVDTPPFSLTQLEPTWEPAPPKVGDDVSVHVQPQGVKPDAVDLLRLDEAGEVVERVAMTPDGQGGFSHTLRQVHEPMTFKLEATGRASRPYTIEPTPTPPTPDDAQAQNPDAGGDDSTGGTTQYDPDAIARRDAAAQNAAAWEELREAIDKLLADLAGAQARAGAIDPADAAAFEELAGDLASLDARAAELAEALGRLQARLPADAAASLAALREALADLQAGQLPPAPGSGQGSNANSSPTPAHWLSQAQQATQSDQARIAQGVGRSDLPTDTGSSTGSPDANKPTFNDPGATGGYDEASTRGDRGPLPPAVMQQVPPSYRPLVTAYFNRLAKEQPTPQPDEQP